VLTTSEGKDWYVLVWGPFDSHTQANDMLATLPAKVKKAKPWVRSVS